MKENLLSIFLIGIPCSGKSTFISQNLKLWEKFKIQIISRDDLLFEETGISHSHYSEAWDYATEHNLHKKIDSDLLQSIRNCVAENKSFILDMTNLRYRARAEKLALLNSAYCRVGILFPAYSSDIEARNISRKNSENKYIPNHIIEDMIYTQQLPSDFTDEFHIIYRSPAEVNLEYCQFLSLKYCCQGRLSVR